MTEPLINNSIKSFAKLSGAPASAARVSTKNIDWGAAQTAPRGETGMQHNKLNRYQDDIQSPLMQMGIQSQSMISLPCIEVNELANKRIHQGKGISFNGQLLNPKPTTGMDEINFVPENRFGRLGIMDVSQSPFTFGSFQHC